MDLDKTVPGQPLSGTVVESNYELMTREPRKNGKKAFYDVFLLYHI